MSRVNYDEVEIGISGIRKLTDLVKQRYNFDLGNYAGTSLKRRIGKVIRINDLKNLDGLTDLLESSPEFFPRFQSQLIVEGTELFRDPAFWRFMRDNVFKTLKNNGIKVKVWIPSCSTGEEVISTAITLEEAGIFENASITATDINNEIISLSRKMDYNNNILEISDNNYKRFKEDDSADFSKYYEASKTGFTFADNLYRAVNYEVFNESDTKNIKGVNVIICRNYFIYLTAPYQEKLFEIYTEKLSLNGFLAIGNKENITFCKDYGKYTVVHEAEKVFKKTSG